VVKYRYVLPRDWEQIRLDPVEPKAVKKATEKMFSNISDEVARVRISGWVTSRMISMLEPLSERGAWAAYLPVEDPRASVVRPMIVTRPFDATEIGDDPMEAVLAMATSGEGETSLIQPSGMVGAKLRIPEDAKSALLDSLDILPDDVRELTDEKKMLAAAAERTRLVRQVCYIIGQPGNPERWMHVEASVSCDLAEGAGEALDAVEEFFDAWVETLSWEDDDDE
jgi:hypothetical protein